VKTEVIPWRKSHSPIAVGCSYLLLLLAAGPLPGQSPSEASHGLRRLEGQYVTLVTDIPSSPAIDELPRVFDQAVPQWADYFRVAAPTAKRWHLRGYLMRSRPRFQQAALLSDDLPPFLHGYQRGNEFWVWEQPSDYFVRHLMLHEGTHAFMRFTLGGTGPPWYMEGMAELLATHRWADDHLTLNVFPRRREDVPYWGRIKIVQQATAQGHALSLGDVFQLEGTRFRQVEPYAWCWAAAAFLDGHPRWASRFRRLPRRVSQPDESFSRHFWRELQDAPQELQEAWQLFVAHLDYGYRPAADQVSYRPVRPVIAGAQTTVAVDRGWQSTGWRLDAGRRYRVRAEGRYQLAREPDVWWCEPDGVTLQYYAGLPLGLLLAAIRTPPQPGERTALLAPQALGHEAILEPDTTGVLFLQVNERAGGRGDNRGQLTVWIEPLELPSPD